MLKNYYEIVAEAIRLTENGESVTLPVNGHSMLPFSTSTESVSR